MTSEEGFTASIAIGEQLLAVGMLTLNEPDALGEDPQVFLVEHALFPGEGAIAMGVGKQTFRVRLGAGAFEVDGFVSSIGVAVAGDAVRQFEVTGFAAGLGRVVVCVRA